MEEDVDPPSSRFGSIVGVTQPAAQEKVPKNAMALASMTVFLRVLVMTSG
jgi:hypothetical protein